MKEELLNWDLIFVYKPYLGFLVPFANWINTGNYARLKALQKTAETNQTMDGELLALLGTSYEQVRAFNEAIIIYDKILANARQSGDNLAVEATLNKLGQIHLSRFDYQKAAPSAG